MYYSIEILEDINALVETLSFEENQELIRCTMKMRNHLQNQVISGNKRFEKNIELLDMVIETHVNKSLETNVASFFPIAS